METSEATTYVVFRLGGTRYALPAPDVVEVLQMAEPIPVPSWPVEVLGLLNVRGELLPLVEVAPLLNGTPLVLSASQFVMVLQALGRNWGVVIDRVESVGPLAVKASHEVPTAEFLRIPSMCVGIAHDAEGAILVLAPDSLIAPLKDLSDVGDLSHGHSTRRLTS